MGRTIGDIERATLGLDSLWLVPRVVTYKLAVTGAFIDKRADMGVKIGVGH